MTINTLFLAIENQLHQTIQRVDIIHLNLFTSILLPILYHLIPHISLGGAAAFVYAKTVYQGVIQQHGLRFNEVPSQNKRKAEEHAQVGHIRDPQIGRGEGVIHDG